MSKSFKSMIDVSTSRILKINKIIPKQVEEMKQWWAEINGIETGKLYEKSNEIEI